MDPARADVRLSFRATTRDRTTGGYQDCRLPLSARSLAAANGRGEALDPARVVGGNEQFRPVRLQTRVRRPDRALVGASLASEVHNGAGAAARILWRCRCDLPSLSLGASTRCAGGNVRPSRLHRLGPAKTSDRSDKGILRKLEPHFAVLEQNGIDRVGVLDEAIVWPSAAARQAARSIAELTQGVTCHRREASPSSSPGIDLALGDYGTTTTHPDAFARRIQTWLDSEHATTLRTQLANELEGTERHAVLVFDPAVEPGTDISVSEFLPSVPLELPPEIDVAWFVVGAVACQYTASNGWLTLDART
jgi:hypothetical protein